MKKKMKKMKNMWHQSLHQVRAKRNPRCETSLSPGFQHCIKSREQGTPTHFTMID